MSVACNSANINRITHSCGNDNEASADWNSFCFRAQLTIPAIGSCSPAMFSNLVHSRRRKKERKREREGRENFILANGRALPEYQSDHYYTISFVLSLYSSLFLQQLTRRCAAGLWPREVKSAVEGGHSLVQRNSRYWLISRHRPTGQYTPGNLLPTLLSNNVLCISCREAPSRVTGRLILFRSMYTFKLDDK